MGLTKPQGASWDTDHNPPMPDPRNIGDKVLNPKEPVYNVLNLKDPGDKVLKPKDSGANTNTRVPWRSLVVPFCV